MQLELLATRHKLNVHKMFRRREDRGDSHEKKSCFKKNLGTESSNVMSVNVLKTILLKYNNLYKLEIYATISC